LSKKSQNYFKHYNGASGVLITNVYLNTFSFIIGDIPSHSNEFNNCCQFLSENITADEIDLILSKKNKPQRLNVEYSHFEDFLTHYEV